jgi:hypothetical protein
MNELIRGLSFSWLISFDVIPQFFLVLMLISITSWQSLYSQHLLRFAIRQLRAVFTNESPNMLFNFIKWRFLQQRIRLSLCRNWNSDEHWLHKLHHHERLHKWCAYVTSEVTFFFTSLQRLQLSGVHDYQRLLAQRVLLECVSVVAFESCVADLLQFTNDFLFLLQFTNAYENLNATCFEVQSRGLNYFVLEDFRLLRVELWEGWIRVCRASVV